METRSPVERTHATAAAILFAFLTMTTGEHTPRLAAGGRLSGETRRCDSSVAGHRLLPLPRKAGSEADETGPAQTTGGQGPVAPQRIPDLQNADRDVLGDSLLTGRSDPGFESVAGLLPALKRPREVVGVKHHPHDIGVAPDASLELSDDVDAAGSPVAFFEVGTPPVRFGSPPGALTKELLGGSLPVVIASYRLKDFLFRQTIFGWSEGLSPDADLWAYVSLDVRSLGRSPAIAAVRFRVLPKAGAEAPANWSLKIAPEASERICVKVPFGISSQQFAEAAAVEFDARFRQVVDFWTHDLESGLNLVTPEKRVNDAYKAWKAFASLDVDKRNGLLEPHDGAGFYEEVYGYSAALYAHALDLWGRHHDARACLESLLSLQAPDGLFYQNFGTPDSGALLLALSAHFDLTGDAAWLKSASPKMIKMADWIIRKRRESTTGEAGTNPLTFGLIKFRPYCDYQQPAFDYFGDTYCAAGLERTAAALAAVGLNDEAGRVRREAAAYRRDILKSMDRAAMIIGGMKVLPMEPDTHRLLKGSKERAGGYYGLIASCMLESEFLQAADERAAMVRRFIEERGGLRLGMAEFDGGIDHAYTYGYWLDNLKLDRVEPAILGFYGSLAYGMSRDTYSGVEVTHMFTGENEPTLPHLYSCTQQLRLLRMMVLREDGSRLWVAQAAPRSWLGDGKAIEVKDAPTSFGPVSFRIESHVARGEVLVDWNPPARRTPEAVYLKLRHPSRKAISGVRVNGRPSTRFLEETLSLDSPGSRLKIVVSY